jgi:hypothetical protein
MILEGISVTQKIKYRIEWKDVVSGEFVFDAESNQSAASAIEHVDSFVLKPGVVISPTTEKSPGLLSINRRLARKSVAGRKILTAS